MNRFDHLMKSYKQEQEKARVRRTIEIQRPVVEVNGEGTTGYRFKHGPNKGRVAAHITVNHPNKKYD